MRSSSHTPRRWRSRSLSLPLHLRQIGGKSGYSAKNFVRAISHTQSPDAKVFTVDIYPVPKQAQNHIVLTKNASNLTPADVENRHIDLLFFDCHDLGAQMNLYNELQKGGVITDDTVRPSSRMPYRHTPPILAAHTHHARFVSRTSAALQVVAVHDTNLYYYPQADGTLATRAHQVRSLQSLHGIGTALSCGCTACADVCERRRMLAPAQGVERDMVNWLKTIGYDAFSIRTSPRRHSDKCAD